MRSTLLFHACDDRAAKGKIKNLIESMGFEATDAGPLANSRHPESMGMLNIWLGYMAGRGTGIAPASRPSSVFYRNLKASRRLIYSHMGIYIGSMPRAATTSDVFNAVAESRRRDVLSFLAGQERSAGDIVATLGLEQPSVSS